MGLFSKGIIETRDVCTLCCHSDRSPAILLHYTISANAVDSCRSQHKDSTRDGPSIPLLFECSDTGARDVKTSDESHGKQTPANDPIGAKNYVVCV